MRCPHCGERLPEMLDAFGPECRQPLEDLPRVAETGGESAVANENSLTSALLILAGLGWLGIGVFVMLKVHAVIGLLTVGAGFAILIAGLWWARVSAREE